MDIFSGVVAAFIERLARVLSVSSSGIELAAKGWKYRDTHQKRHATQGVLGPLSPYDPGGLPPVHRQAKPLTWCFQSDAIMLSVAWRTQGQKSSLYGHAEDALSSFFVLMRRPQPEKEGLIMAIIYLTKQLT